MATMVAKVPTPNTATSAIFSLRGRLMLSSVLMGSAKMMMSVMMLKPDVTAASLVRVR
jgi:hypothetical protein